MDTMVTTGIMDIMATTDIIIMPLLLMMEKEDQIIIRQELQLMQVPPDEQTQVRHRRQPEGLLLQARKLVL